MIRLRTSLVILGLLVGVGPGTAQSVESPGSGAPGWRVGVGAGWVQHATHDRLASSQSFSGWGTPVSVRVERTSRRSVHELMIRFSSLSLPARNGGPATVDELGVALRYSYDRRVSGGRARAWYVGGAWETTAFLRAYGYGGGEVWDGHSRLAVRGRVEQRLGNGGMVGVIGSFGLLGWSMRPPYSVEDNTTLVLHESPTRIVTGLGRITTPLSRPSAAIRVRFSTPLWRGLSARVGYALEWSYAREPRPATTARSGLDLALTYGFGGTDA